MLIKRHNNSNSPILKSCKFYGVTDYHLFDIETWHFVNELIVLFSFACMFLWGYGISLYIQNHLSWALQSLLAYTNRHKYSNSPYQNELVDESSKLIEHHYILNIFRDIQYEMPQVPLYIDWHFYLFSSIKNITHGFTWVYHYRAQDMF